MKGRGTRTLPKDDLRKVTPSAVDNKTHYVIVDAVGVCKSLKTDSRPLERKPSIPLKDLMMNIAMGSREEDILISTANRLTRIDRAVSENEKEKFKEVTSGTSIKEVVKALLNANDPDFIQTNAREKYKLEEKEILTKEQIKETQKEFLDKACDIFNNPDIREYIENVRKKHEQIIDTINIDTVINADWDKQTQNQAENTIETFKEFLKKNKDEITALKIFYSQPQRIKEITFKMINELYSVLKSPPYSLTVEKLWGAYYQLGNNKVKGVSTKRMLTDIVSLIRYELKIDKELAPFSEIINRNFKEWVFRKNAGHIQFTEDQMEWLRMIKDHIMTSMKITQDNFNFTPFDALGGIGKFYQIFGEDYNEIINELNEVLVA